MLHWERLMTLRKRELEAEFEQIRLLTLADRARRKRRFSYRHVLFQFGTRLSMWGELIRERYCDTDMAVQKDRMEHFA